jgi:transaldolase
VLYVEELIGPDSVNTMPESTLRAFKDHGILALTLEGGIDEAWQLLARLAEAGIDYDNVVETLETEGIQKFVDSFSKVLDGLEAKESALGSRAVAGSTP